MNTPIRPLSYAFMKIYLRDRQSLFFSLLMPFIFLALLGSIYGGARETSIVVGVVDEAQSSLSSRFVAALSQSDGLDVVVLESTTVDAEIASGDITLALIIPHSFKAEQQGVTLNVVFDGSKYQLAMMTVSLLERTLVDIERELRGSEPMFSLEMRDIQSGNIRYLDFLLPGILAMSLMQTSIAGSGFNIVEYRRRGILKRLFVTPIRPLDFIAALSVSRLLLVMLQISVLIFIGVGLLGANVTGNLLLLYGVAALGSISFLCMGFAVGGLAKTQDSVNVIGNLIILPQMFLSGIFFPIEAMPDWLQPVVNLLPLSYVVSGMRDVAVNGAGLMDVLPSLMGIAVWTVGCFLLATRFFVWREVIS